MRVCAGHVTVQSDLVQHGIHSLSTFGLGQIVVQSQRQRNLLRHGHHRVQRMGRILEYRTHIPAAQIGKRMLVGVRSGIVARGGNPAFTGNMVPICRAAFFVRS